MSQAAALRAEAAAASAAEAARQRAALDVIAPWAPTFRERARFLALRCDCWDQ